MAKIFVCGDIVNCVPTGAFVGDKLSHIIRQADFSVCNFEGPELMNNQTARYPHQEPGTAAYLKSIGFGLMLLANNHITELGAEGVRYSIDTIKRCGADCIGAGLSWDETYKPVIKEIRGKKYGFINVCEAQVGQFLSSKQTFGYAWMGYKELFDDIRKLSQSVAHVLVFVHAGLEHYSIPLPEIREFYYRICDAGADAVVGGHTHTAQGWEYYKEKLIVYSLGNFYFPYEDGKRPEENTSYSMIIYFTDNGDIKVLPIHHCLSQGKVELLEDSSKQIDMRFLCNLLTSDYQEKATKMCISAYDTLCSHLLAEATYGEYEGITFKRWLIERVRQVFMRRHYVKDTRQRRNALLLRLFENETYRWTIIRALKNKQYE